MNNSLKPANNCLNTPPDANTSVALSLLSEKINKLQSSHPDGVHICHRRFQTRTNKFVLQEEKTLQAMFTQTLNMYTDLFNSLT